MSPMLLEQPRTLDEAIRTLRDDVEAAVLAGGTDLVVHSRSRRVPLPRKLVSLDRLDDLHRIFIGEAGSLHLGATATHAMIEENAAIRTGWTALVDAASIIGSPATRHLGTVGGNLCNGSPAMELGGPLLAYDAQVVLTSSSGSRALRLDEFLLGPGRTARRRDELVTEVIVPALTTSASGSAYARLGFRESMEIAIVGVTAAISLDGDGRVSACRIALTAVAPTVVRAAQAESVLLGQEPSPNLLSEAADRALLNASPIDDVRAPAEYRRLTTPVMTLRALELALRRARS